MRRRVPSLRRIIIDAIATVILGLLLLIALIIIKGEA